MIVEHRNLYNYCSLLVLTMALNDTRVVLLVRRFSRVHSFTAWWFLVRLTAQQLPLLSMVEPHCGEIRMATASLAGVRVFPRFDNDFVVPLHGCLMGSSRD